MKDMRKNEKKEEDKKEQLKEKIFLDEDTMSRRHLTWTQTISIWIQECLEECYLWIDLDQDWSNVFSYRHLET